MKTLPDAPYIQKLISEGEHRHQDFKFAISDSRKIAKSLSAFANTEGGRLLVGVKDNGKIAGIRSEEEIYMIEAAASMYCRPPLTLDNHIHRIEGKEILIAEVAESSKKPVCALDENNKARAYIRIKDENILASPVHLNVWRHDRKKNIIVTYTRKEQQLLNIIGQYGPVSLNQCCRLAQTSRKQTSGLLADFIRFNLVEPVFKEHTFYFQLKDSE